MSGGPLVLASTSEARLRLAWPLWHSLGCELVTIAPSCDERALRGATPAETALLRALAKAESVRDRFERAAWIVGSDQVVELEGRELGKPGTVARACAQLAELAGKTHRVITAVAVLGPDRRESRVVVSQMTMHPLSAEAIAAYVAADAPFGCAGSYKLECGGRALFARIETPDESAIEGLPLAALSGMLGPLRGEGTAPASTHFDSPSPDSPR